MSDTAKLGTLPDETAQRDAIHVAIAPLVAAEKLFRGTDVGLNDDGEATTETMDWIGIVDPFRTLPVEKGQRVWVILYPGTATNLRHEWEHPAFKAKVEEVEAPDWCDMDC